MSDLIVMPLLILKISSGIFLRERTVTKNKGSEYETVFLYSKAFIMRLRTKIFPQEY